MSIEQGLIAFTLGGFISLYWDNIRIFKKINKLNSFKAEQEFYRYFIDQLQADNQKIRSRLSYLEAIYEADKLKNEIAMKMEEDKND